MSKSGNNAMRNLARSRSIARKCAMQALYQWQLTQQSSTEIEAQFLGSEELKGGDVEYFSETLHTVVERQAELDEILQAYLDRPAAQLDPVEHAILLVGMFELIYRLDVPFRVVINEGVELSKRFGATDGHRYVNGVLDKAAREKRPGEQA